ncbi:MAG: tetratricopeptide repeat protein [Treponema sp.]|nr:tetratricopeptide repeat protein [Treponema sp.]
MNNEKEKEKKFIMTRANAAVISRDFTLAARLYKSLLKNDPGNIGLLSALGSLYVKAGDDRKALLYFEQIRTLSSNNFEALNSMGGIYRRLQRYEDSINVLQQALDLGLNDAQVNYNLGFTYRSMGAYDQAIECFESVIEENPNDVLAYNHLGVIYALRKNHRKAVDVYKRGLQVDPNHPILQLNLAKSYEMLHDDNEASIAFEAALRAKPGWLEAIRDYTELLLRHRNTKAAANLVQKSILLYPNNIDMQNLLGRIYLKQYDYNSARQIFEKARRSDSHDIDVLTGLAETYEKTGRSKDAAGIMQEAGQIKPDDTGVTRQYAHVLLSAGETQAAVAKIKKIYKENKNDVKTLDLCGQYYICCDDDDRAELVYKKINKIDSSYDEYKKEASERYKQKGQLSKAVRCLEQYMAKHQEDPAGLIALARIQEASGDTAAALESYSKVLKFDPFNVLAGNELQRLGSITGRADKQLPVSGEAAFDDENTNGEIVLDTPVEEELTSVSADENQSEENQEPFDFDVMGDSLLEEDDEKNPFILSDKAAEDDEADKKGEDSQGLEQLIPADQPIDIPEKADEDSDADDTNDMLDGIVKPAEPAEPSAAGETEDGFGTENIEENPEHQLLSSVSDTDNEINRHPAADREKPAEYTGRVSDFTQENRLPEEKKDEKSVVIIPPQPDLSGKMLDRFQTEMDRVKAQNDSTLAAVQKTYDAVQSAAERAWNAAEQAADSAQGVDNAISYINQMTTDAAQKAAENAVKKVQESIENTEISPAASDPVDEEIPFAETEEAQNIPVENEELQTDDCIPSEESETICSKTAADYDTMIDKAAGLLPDIVSKLEKRENAEKFMTQLELFKQLRELCGYLPPGKKEVFMSSRTRMLLDYVIDKLSGRPGLILTAEELRRTELLSDVFPAEVSVLPSSGITDRQLAHTVIENMREMVNDLPDAYLAKALDTCAVEALKTL